MPGKHSGLVAAGLGLLLLLVAGLPGEAGEGVADGALQGARVGRVVRDFAAVHEGPGADYAVVWRLYEGSQVAALGEASGADGSAWRQVRLWNSQDGWLEAEALSFAPFPPPPTPDPAGGGAAGAGGGPCRPLPERQPHSPRSVSAAAMVLAPTGLSESPEDEAPGASLAAGTSVSVDGWTVASDGRVRYHARAEGTAGWAAPGSVALRAADPLTREVGGQPIVEPLRGKGLWYILDSREHGTAPAPRVAAAARANGLSHLYVEVATSRGGFWGARWLEALLPAARAAGVRVIGSVYVCLEDLAADLALSLEVARYRAPGGLALDGLTADIEEKLDAANVQAYGELLRHYLGDDYLLVATVYPPESWYAPRYPWPALARSWNAVAPMAYWRQMEQRAFSASEVYAYTWRNIEKVRALVGRPDVPVEMLGQLFEMGRPRLFGPDAPAPGEVEAAARAARDAGAVGISYFDWTRATPAQWEALAAFEW